MPSLPMALTPNGVVDGDFLQRESVTLPTKISCSQTGAVVAFITTA